MIVELAHAFLTAVQAHYPGGLRAFNHDDGEVQVAPLSTHKYRICVFHPLLPSSFEEKLGPIAAGLRTIAPCIVNVYDTPAYVGEDPGEMMYALGAALRGLEAPEGVTVAVAVPTRAVVAVSLPGTKHRDPFVKAVERCIHALPEVRRVAVVTPDGGLFVEKGPLWRRQARAEAHTSDPGPISHDDILNLRIALETDPWELFSDCSDAAPF